VHVEHQTLRTGYARSTGLAPRQSEGLELEYKGGAAFLTIQEATAPSFAYRWPTRDTLWPVPPVGAVRIQPFGWGFPHREGLYISIMSSLGEDAVLVAARTLEPIPG
jgi:hypothetical protein